jgi:hypothetical protein
MDDKLDPQPDFPGGFPDPGMRLRGLSRSWLSDPAERFDGVADTRLFMSGP